MTVCKNAENKFKTLSEIKGELVINELIY